GRARTDSTFGAARSIEEDSLMVTNGPDPDRPADERRVVVLTGATAGIGRALAERLIALGHVVHGCGRTVRALDELLSRHGAPHTFEAVAVADADAVQAWAARRLASGRAPDLLVNNAA